VTEQTAATRTDGTDEAAHRRPAIPAPRTSPENGARRVPAPDPYDGYPEVRYALEHLTALRPGEPYPGR